MMLSATVLAGTRSGMVTVKTLRPFSTSTFCTILSTSSMFSWVAVTTRLLVEGSAVMVTGYLLFLFGIVRALKASVSDLASSSALPLTSGMNFVTLSAPSLASVSGLMIAFSISSCCLALARTTTMLASELAVTTGGTMPVVLGSAFLYISWMLVAICVALTTSGSLWVFVVILSSSPASLSTSASTLPMRPNVIGPPVTMSEFVRASGTT